MYTLVPTPQYEAEFQQVSSGATPLLEILDRTVFPLLRQDPHLGTLNRTRQLWLIRQRILHDLLMVQIWYRIDEVAGTVTLVSIVPVNLTGGL